MKLIIDIPEELYNTLRQGNVVDDAILNGIPLDDIKAEIKEVINENKGIGSNDSEAQNTGLMWVLGIIDKHIGG